eukprot:TRINITY_DN5530_c1_g2_i1.p1 TRINITY_DN5530_c1_g2~~TRINITY_DN5530_c1_g2_i1.p1  ORF type:complete len:524 (-),score=50.79 TRINITY_DN5530_c1_g2_i1:200-1771(-)
MRTFHDGVIVRRSWFGVALLASQIYSSSAMCPTDPLSGCDFYFEGYQTSLPVISLNGGADTGVSPYVVDSVSGDVVMVGSTGEGTLLCTAPTNSSLGSSAGNQFYLNGQRSQVHVRTFNYPTKTSYENLCIQIPLYAAQIGSLNLNWGDNQQTTYPNARRCVVFQTGPSGASCASTSAFPPPSSPPPTAPPPASPLFPAIFAFGDSEFDVGTFYYLPNATTYVPDPPYGVSYKPGRICNGRLMSDYISDYVGIPPADPFLQTNSTTREYGINFASDGASVLAATSAYSCGNGSCIPFQTQIQQFEYASVGYSAAVLSSSLYLIYIGENDYFNYFIGTYLLNTTPTFTVETLITDVIKEMATEISTLYAVGARKIIVFEASPIGCVPLLNWYLKAGTCLTSLNQVVEAHNAALVALQAELSAALPGLYLSIATNYGPQLNFSTSPAAYGFQIPLTACCGSGAYNGDPFAACGVPAYNLCTSPDEYVFWDFFHPTTANYKKVAEGVIYGTEGYVTPYSIQDLAGL